MMRRFGLFPLLILLILVLAACGSDDNGASNDAAAPAATATETATPEPEPTATEPVQSASVDESEEATAEPTPTEAPPEPPAADDDSASEAPAASSGGGWGESGSGAQTACDHPYFPLRPGSTWTLQGSQGLLVWEVTDVQGDQNSATAVLSATVGDVTIDYTFDCSADGGLASFDFANLGVAPAGAQMTIEQRSAEGHFLPPADQLVPGATWTTNLEGDISYTQDAGGTTIEVLGEMSTIQEHRVLGADPVQFEGQAFEGLQLEQVSQISMALTVLGTVTNQNQSITNTYDLGRGIGIVSQTSVTQFGTETVELISYYIP